VRRTARLASDLRARAGQLWLCAGLGTATSARGSRVGPLGRHPSAFDATPSTSWPVDKKFGGISAMSRFGRVWKTLLKVEYQKVPKWGTSQPTLRSTEAQK
jgi:hypothetical protein